MIPTSQGRDIAPIGRLDFSDGLRAYAAPDDEIHLGGRTFSGGAAGVPRHRRRRDAATACCSTTPAARALLDESGTVVDLEPGAEKTDFHPTAKVDSQAPLVAYGADPRRCCPLVVVRDLSTDEVAARHEVPAERGDRRDRRRRRLHPHRRRHRRPGTPGPTRDAAARGTEDPSRRRAQRRPALRRSDVPTARPPRRTGWCRAASTPSSPTTAATSSTGRTGWSRPTAARRSCSTQKGDLVRGRHRRLDPGRGAGQGRHRAPVLRLRGALRHAAPSSARSRRSTATRCSSASTCSCVSRVPP